MYRVTITPESLVCMNKEYNDNLGNWRPMANVSDYLCISCETVLQWIEKTRYAGSQGQATVEVQNFRGNEWIRSVAVESDEPSNQ